MNEPGSLVRNDLVTPTPEPARAFYSAVFDYTLDRNEDLPDFDDPRGWQIDAVQAGTVSYVRFPAVADRLPAGKSWIRTDGKANVQGFDLDQFATSDPRTLLDLLKAASAEIETLGTEELHGVETTHYRATIDPREYAKAGPTETREELFSLVEQMGVQSGLATVPVDVWLDSEGLVRKLSLEISASAAMATAGSENFYRAHFERGGLR